MRDPASTPFVITIDSDTQLPHDVARKLIGTLAHPLNRPQFDHEVQAQTVQFPIGAQSNRATRFSTARQRSAGKRWQESVCAAGGRQSWCGSLRDRDSDVYQDLFGEGSFTGKGIYDLHAFERALEHAFPENAYSAMT